MTMALEAESDQSVNKNYKYFCSRSMDANNRTWYRLNRKLFENWN